MLKTSVLAILFAALMSSLSFVEAQTIYKCTLNGSVTYQSDICPSSVVRKFPTAAELNTERQKRQQQAADGTLTSHAPVAGDQRSSSSSMPSGSVEKSEKVRATPAALPTAPASASFMCDRRQHCSQMTSCAESKYFLAHCPGVKMDGDRNGIPCEQQWCNK
jgi:hypothetical protein